MPTQDRLIKYLPLEKLRYDPLNPRLLSTVDGHNERAVLTAMLKDGTITELMGSIGEQGYFAGEPLIVCSNPDEADTYIVVEGNRRFTAVKLINNPEQAPTNKISVLAISDVAKHKPTELPCVIYDKREEILDYLSYRHITGIKTWGSLAKAKYLEQLRNGVATLPIQEQFKSLARTIGTRADYVDRLLTGYAVYEAIVRNDFFHIDNLNEGSIDFSILTTALTYSNIIRFLNLKGNDDPSVEGLDVRKLEELTRWMFQKLDQGKTRLGESRNLKYLSSVVANEKALKSFRDGTPLVDAKDLTEAPADIFRNSISQALARLERARDNLHLVNKPTSSDEDNLTEINSLARSMRASVREKLLDAEDEIT